MMLFERVIVKQIPDIYAELTGLSKYGRSKMPMTSESLQPGIGPDGRFITGIDEDAYAVFASIPDESQREKKRAELKTLRESLQKLTGKDLSGTSTFWETFFVRIYADQDLILDLKSPIDLIRYRMMVANGYAAPDQHSAALPEFRQAKYYCYTEEKANHEEVSTQKMRDMARGRLLEISKDHDHAVLIGQALVGDKFKLKMSDDAIYKALSDYISDATQPENLKKFIKAVNASVEELQFKITIDRAFKKKIIRRKDKYYQRGQVTLGKTIEEVYLNLQTPEYAGEFLSIKDEIESYN